MAHDGEATGHSGDSPVAGSAFDAHARALLEQGQLAEAEAAYRDLQARHPDRPAGLSGLAMVAMQSGQWQTALDRFDECLAGFPSRSPPFWRLARARALARLGRREEAEAAYEAQAGQSPGDAKPLIQLYGTLAFHWPAPRKLVLLDRIAAIAPSDRWCRVERAMVWARSGRLREARGLVESVVIEDAGDGTWSVQELKTTFQAVQFCSSDYPRIVLLERLSALAKERANGEQGVAAAILHGQLRLALGDHEEAGRIVAGLRSRGVAHEMVAGMEEICARRADAAYPDYAAPKVFCIGLSKTATSSLDEALKALGLRTVHWLNRSTETLLSESDLFLFDGFSDIVVSWRFEHLYTTFPNARFIYTTRRTTDWVRSITAHYERLHGLSSPHDLQKAGFRERFNGAAGMAEMNLYARHATWEEAYGEFDRRVRHFFADKPAEKWLEMAVCDGEGWEKLCGFLGRPVPDRPFPSSNVAPRPA